MELSEEVYAGQAVYSKSILSFYDVFVLGFSNTFVWKCKTQKILEHYNQHVSSHHLDVGVGTGYFIDKCKFPSDIVHLGLMDLNENSLGKTALRVARYKPKLFISNILEPVAVEVPQYDSISINYLLHCLPGSIDSKSIIFDHLKTKLTKDGIIFGSTLLSSGVTRSAIAKKFMRVYNRKGIFSNNEDSLDELIAQLILRFSDVEVEVEGSVAIFSAKNSLDMDTD